MQVREIDVHDDEEMRRFHEIGYRGEMEDGRPWNAFQTYEEMAAVFRSPTPGTDNDALAVFDGDGMVGAGLVWLSTEDNLDKATVVPIVEPALRGRGVGGLLLEALVEHARGLGRTVLMSGASIAFEDRESSPVMHFAKAHDFGLSNTEVIRSLPLPVAGGLLDQVDAEATAHRRGYEICTFVDDVPEALLDSYCNLVNQLVVDAPTGEVEFEQEAYTAEAVRQEIDRDRRVGRTVVRSFALLGGQVVAHTDLLLRPTGARALQWGTFVDRAHRGHRLGAAVKVANLRWLQRERPDITDVLTQNGETNAQMIGINEQLGFRPVALAPEFVRRLP